MFKLKKPRALKRLRFKNGKVKNGRRKDRGNERGAD